MKRSTVNAYDDDDDDDDDDNLAAECYRTEAILIHLILASKWS
jgi:hypothetical protein